MDDSDDHSEPLPQNPSITIDKVTADGTTEDDGLNILVGEAIQWIYTVTNDGNVTLRFVTVTDNPLDDSLIHCGELDGPNYVENLAPGHSLYCYADGTAAAGLYQNTGTASGEPPIGENVTDSDTSSYFGADPQIAIDKVTVDGTASGDGLEILTDEFIGWKYTVTNIGNVLLSNVSVSDNQGVSVTCPQDTLALGESMTCTASGTAITGDYTNTGTASGSYTDDAGHSRTDTETDTSSYFGADPQIAIDKVTVAGTESGDDLVILTGESIIWRYSVTNVGNVPLSTILVTDSEEGVTPAYVSGDDGDDVLEDGEIWIYEASGTAITGEYTNTGTASGSYTDDAGHSRTDTETDDSSYFGAAPAISIDKTFADDSVIAGGEASSFKLVVTNDGNVALSDVLVTDSVDTRLVVIGVSGTMGSDADTDGDAQTVEWLIPSLAVGDSATITVNFAVGSSEPEALGVFNEATASSDYTDDAGNSTTVDDEDSDTIDILVDINLSIVKAFVPDELQQGHEGTFTIEVSNAGPSDAVDVDVTDTVEPELEVTSVTVTSGSGTCTDSHADPQAIECQVDIPADESVLITVTYIAAPAVPEEPIFGTEEGDEFRIIFVNGSILEGSTDPSHPVILLDGVEITDEVQIISDLGKNDILFDPPPNLPIDGVDDPAFLIHLSCSDRFIGGWAESDGPAEGIDVNWQIASYSISRYNQNGFIKSCGDTPVKFDVPNIASAAGWDSFEPNPETVQSEDAMVLIVDPSLVFPEDDAVDFKNRDVYFKLVSENPEDMVITQIEIVWPVVPNGALKQIMLGKNTIWTGSESEGTAVIYEAGFTGSVSDRTLEALQKEKLRFSFENKPVADPDLVKYVFVVTFADGTDVSIVTPYNP